MQVLSGLMSALQSKPSLAVDSSEVMNAHENYAPCSSYELTLVVLPAVASCLLKILGS